MTPLLRRWPVLLLWLTGSIAQALAADAPAPDFEYNHQAPLDVKEVGQEKKFDALVRDVTFDGGSGPVRAYIVTPAAGGTGQAGILYVHWLGETATTNRTEFLNEAIALCSQGVVSVLVDTMWAQPKWYERRVPENDYAQSVKQVIELRRAMDLLLAQPGVDPQRIAYVGHDFGAMYGAVLAGVDKRARTYVLMAGVPHLADWMLFAAKPKDLAAYKAQLAVLDPVLFQFASHDEYVSAAAAAEFYNAAAPRKQMVTYDSGHDLHKGEVTTDRVAWLFRTLALKQ